MKKTEEYLRIYDSLQAKVPPWRKWGAYVSDRAWGTVREDYSANGDAWNYFPHDLARSKAYRWGEDGIAGWCDRYQFLIFSFAFWNGKDPILKERLFGLSEYEGNHGEDVKECYFYLDGTPTHSYMKFLYKYPQEEFPYDRLVDENRKRTTKDREFELVDTGIFDQNRYFDIVIEYAKASADEVIIRLEICNRSNEEASIHVLPQLFFRNRWLWDPKQTAVPSIKEGPSQGAVASLCADPTGLPPPDWLAYAYQLPVYYLYGEKGDDLLFTHNDTHNERVWGPQIASRTPYVKDAFHRYIVEGEKNSVNPQKEGTKACFYYKDVKIPGRQSRIWHFHLTPHPQKAPLQNADAVIALRKKEADAFYAAIQTNKSSLEDKSIQRQAYAGMIWSTQYYLYEVKPWLEGDNPALKPPESRYGIRNGRWQHLHASDLISMPDKWEYPWFASWDMAFHSVVLSQIDLPLAKVQLELFIKSKYQHPNGQVPAYEWNFSDTNPPVQAWALWQLYQKEVQNTGEGDFEYLEFCFLKLMNNFDWWVNKVDRFGNNIFEGGFLGLDNISIVDRSVPLPNGEYFEQSDASGWMGFFALMMMRIALELTKKRPLFDRIAFLFLQHFVAIASAMQGKKFRKIDLWDETDGFFYDAICYPSGAHELLKVRSCVGLIPFFSLEFLSEEQLKQFPSFYDRFQLYRVHFPELVQRCITPTSRQGKKGFLFSLMTLDQMKRMLGRVFQPDEFFSPFGLRSLSKYHQNHPFAFGGSQVSYEPGESLEKIKGGEFQLEGSHLVSH